MANLEEELEIARELRGKSSSVAVTKNAPRAVGIFQVAARELLDCTENTFIRPDIVCVQ